MPIKRKKAESPRLLEVERVGRLHEVTACQDCVQIQYEHPNGSLFVGDAARWLATLPAESVDLVFADPPYNLGKAAWDSFESQESYIAWSLDWIREAARVLKDTGSL